MNQRTFTLKYTSAFSSHWWFKGEKLSSSPIYGALSQWENNYLCVGIRAPLDSTLKLKASGNSDRVMRKFIDVSLQCYDTGFYDCFFSEVRITLRQF